jgi:hypothetical protein
VVVVSRDPGREPLAEEVAAMAVAAVERERVGPAQAVHAVREAPALGLDDQVIAGRHQAEGEAPPLVQLHLGGKEPEEEPALVVVEEDRGARDSARRDVVDARRRELVTGSSQRVRR